MSIIANMGDFTSKENIFNKRDKINLKRLWQNSNQAQYIVYQQGIIIYIVLEAIFVTASLD